MTSTKHGLLSVSIILLSLVFYSTSFAASIRNPNVERIIERIQAPEYVNKEAFSGLVSYVYSKLKPYQYIVEQCIRKRATTGACREQAMHFPLQERVIEDITLEGKSIIVSLRAYKSLAVRSGQTMIFTPGFYGEDIIWQVNGSFFDLVPGKPEDGQYFCPTQAEVKEVLDGRSYIIDTQNLKWQVNNAQRASTLQGKKLHLKVVSTPGSKKTVFCIYSHYLSLSLHDSAIEVEGKGGLWNRQKAGFCQGLNHVTIKRTQCPFMIKNIKSDSTF